MLRPALAAIFALALAAPAAAFHKPIDKSGNLDGDPDKETVRVRPVLPPDAQTDFQRTEVRVSDSCPGGAVDTRIAPVHDDLEKLRLKRADGRPGSEVFLILRDGVRGALGEARLVAWRAGVGQPCRRPRKLFGYDTDHHTRTPSGGDGGIAFFKASIRDITKRFGGLEIAIDERFTRSSDPPSFGSIKKVTYWRFSKARDRYLHYRTVVRRLSTPG